MRPVILVFGLSLLPCAPSRGGEEAGGWEFQQDLALKVLWRLPSGKVTHGHFNVAGTFVRAPLAGEGSPSPPRGWVFAANDPQRTFERPPDEQEEVVYEFGSGALTLGTLHPSGTFAPKVGAKVIGIDDYQPEKDGRAAPRIYNLPGKVVRVPAGRRPKPYQQPPAYEPFSNWERDGKFYSPPKLTQTYKEDLDRLVGFLRDKVVLIGRLDARGDFTPEYDIKPVPYRKEGTVAVTLPDGGKVQVPVINHPAEPYEQVFECRGHSLIYGALRADGSFRPYDGTRVQTWLWYAYEPPDARARIYNLPGTMVPVKPEKPEK